MVPGSSLIVKLSQLRYQPKAMIQEIATKCYDLLRDSILDEASDTTLQMPS